MILLLLTIPAAIADEEKYNLIAETKSSGTSEPNYGFENIPNGEYVIIASAPMGSTGYVDILNITVNNGNVENVNPNVLRVEPGQGLRSNVHEIMLQLQEQTAENENPGSYSISGTIYRTVTSPTIRTGADVYLLQNTIIGEKSIENTSGKYIITVTAYAADDVSIKYTNAGGTETTQTNSTPAGNSFEFEISATDVNFGYTTITITADGENGEEIETLTLSKSDPAKEGVPRKIVVITGYESNAKALNELKQTYSENGSNVDVRIINSKFVESMTNEEINENISGADVIYIHMISTTPTWSKLSSAISNAIADGETILFDDNSTRLQTAYGTYAAPVVPGISDTPGNLEIYSEKLQKYWTSSPYDGTNLEYLFNSILCDFFGRYDLNPPKDVISLPIRAIYHPHMDTLFENSYDEYIKWYETNTNVWEGEETAYTYDSTRPTVGITFYNAYYPAKIEPINKLILELEKSGVNVIAAYTSGSDHDEDVNGGKYFIAGEIDAILNYRYMGGHLFSPEKLDVPVFNILNLDISKQEWEDSSNPLGANTIKTLNQELIGAIDPIVIVSEDWIDGELLGWPIDGQVEYLVDRVMSQLNLQTEDNNDKNIALIYYNHGSGKASIGASYLDVPASIVEILAAMKTDDYNIDMNKVPSSEEIVNNMLSQGINIGTWAPGELKEMIGDVDVSDEKDIYDTGKAVLISKDLYLKWFEEAFIGEWFEESIKTYTEEEKDEKRDAQKALFESKLEEVEELWGTAPGDIMVYKENYIVIPYIDVSDTVQGGRVILTPQPSRGHATDIEILYHDTNIPPTHQYVAFYLWLQHNNRITYLEDADGAAEMYPESSKKRFEADAIISLGRHGTHEWLPGKELALSRYDWPALLAGDVPIIYPYIVDGVGEGIVAKRRGNAVLIDHMTPAIVYAGLYGDYEKLSSSILSYEMTTGGTKDQHKETIISYVDSLGLNQRLNATEEEIREMNDTEFEEMLHEIEDYLENLKSTFMPYGLHIYGTALEGNSLAEMVFSMLGQEYIKNVTAVSGATSDDALLILKDVLLNNEDPGQAIDTVFASKAVSPTASQKSDIISGLTLGQTHASNLQASVRETDQLLRALSGKYIEPKTGGDPVTRPHVVPTGGNFNSIDQRRVPTEQAWKVAVELTDQLLADYYEKHGEWPKSIGYVLWAGESTRTEGVMEAQIMYLIGIEPRWVSGNVDPNLFNPIAADDLKVTLNNGTEVVRPRIDVLVEISGLYRDSFPEKVLMLDRAIRLAYEQPEGATAGTENYIKRNTDVIMSAAGVNKDLALSRIFGPSSDTYGVGMSDLVASTNNWETGSQLAEQFISRMGFIYNSLGEWGTSNDKELYKMQLSNIDATVHSRSSPLYGALDNDDFYQYLGGLNLAVSHSRNDGKSPDSFVMNLQNPGGAKVETLKDFIENETYARYLNQKWMDGMKEHGYAGAREIADTFENMWGWAAMDPNMISDKMWNDIYKQLLTGENGEWMKSNPQYSYSYQSAVARLIQVATKDDGAYWKADPAVLNQLVKDYVESVVQTGVACCHHTCGNPLFDKFVAGQMSVAGVSSDEQKEFLKLLEDATEREISGNTGVGSGSVSSGSARIVSNAEQSSDEGEQSGGYGTDSGTAPTEVTGYEMTTSGIDDAISDLRDFMQNPSFSTSSAAALAIVIFAVGAVFYGLKRKD